MRVGALAASLVWIAATAGVLVAETPPVQPGTPEDARRAWTEESDSTRSIQVITAEEIWRSNARNLPELLEREAAAWMTFATFAGGTPVVRGITGNDILILLDGIKINNTAYRFGPLEVLSTIDLLMLERVELLRAAAGRYGGDTAGPVIRLFTKRDAAPLSPGDTPPEESTARAFFRFSTVDKSTIAHLEAHNEGKRYSAFFGLTSRDIGDLRGGEDTNFQRPTGYEETAGNGRFQYFLSERQTFDLDLQVLEQQNVPQFDRLEHGSHLDFRLNPRKRALFRLTYLDSTHRGWSERLEASVYLNQHRQRALEQLANDPGVISRTSDNNDSTGAQIRLETTLGTRHSLAYGGVYLDETVSAVRRESDVLTGEEISRGTDRRRGGQAREQLRVWIEDHLEVHPELAITVGASFSSASISGTQQTMDGDFDLDSDESALAGFLSAAWSPAGTLTLFASYDHGFRLPGIDDVTSFTDDPKLASLPNTDLEATSIDSFELGLRHRSDRAELSISFFHQELDDTWVLAPLERAAGEPARVRAENLGRSEIDGFEVDLSLHLPKALEFFAALRVAEGDDLAAGTPLAGIPPDHGLAGLRWRGGGRYEPWAEALVRWADDKRRLAPADDADINFDPAAVDAFSNFELRAGVTLPSRLRLILTLQNPDDEDFKRFGSGIWSAGRNLVVAAEYIF